MKLETKFQDEDFELGEVVKAKVTTYYDENKVVVMADKVGGGVSRFEYNSIKDFTDHWEDAPEEPKGYFYIRDGGNIDYYRKEGSITERHKSIGNYFETKEEAEKAAEKLKAWKRLKDKGFRFYRWNKGSLLKSLPNTIEFACDDTEMWTWGDIQDDLDLLFSGGEE